MLALQGKCLRKLKRYDESLQDLTAAHDIYLELTQLEPEIIDHVVELSRTEVRIGVLHLCPDTQEGDETAAKWLVKASARLAILKDSGKQKTQSWPVSQLLDNIRKNQELIRQRAEWRSKHSD